MYNISFIHIVYLYIKKLFSLIFLIICIFYTSKIEENFYFLYTSKEDLENKSREELNDRKEELKRDIEDNESDQRQVLEAIEAEKSMPKEQKGVSNEELEGLKEDFPEYFDENISEKDSLNKLLNDLKDKEESFKSDIEKINEKLEDSYDSSDSGSTTPTPSNPKLSREGTPGNFIDDLPQESPGFLDDGE